MHGHLLKPLPLYAWTLVKPVIMDKLLLANLGVDIFENMWPSLNFEVSKLQFPNYAYFQTLNIS